MGVHPGTPPARGSGSPRGGPGATLAELRSPRSAPNFTLVPHRSLAVAFPPTVRNGIFFPPKVD